MSCREQSGLHRKNKCASGHTQSRQFNYAQKVLHHLVLNHVEMANKFNMQKTMFETNTSKKNISHCCRLDKRHFYVQSQNNNKLIYVNETEDWVLVRNILGGDSAITASPNQRNP